MDFQYLYAFNLNTVEHLIFNINEGSKAKQLQDQ